MQSSQFKYAVITHGGAGSNPNDSDGPNVAALKSMELLKNGSSALEASVIAVKILEDDPRFNAGVGSKLRKDGHTVQFDAACMTSEGQFGAVACVENIKNPIELAQEVLFNSSHILLGGSGAFDFAKERNIPLLDSVVVNDHQENPLKCDTVGALTFDGKHFSASLSSGGLGNSSVGRIGDVPLPGCGLFCGSVGAVACTGDGEFIALKVFAKEVYSWLVGGMGPSAAAIKAISLVEGTVDIGIIILTKEDFSAESRNGMAWSQITKRSV